MPDMDAAYVLFPNDAPKSAQVPTFVQVERAAAEQRLMGQGDNAAALVFPNDAPGGAGGARTGGATPSAGDDNDPASALFPTDAAHADIDYERVVGGELDGATLAAISDGDTDRAEELKAATAALSENFKTAGTDPAEISEALQIVRQSAGIHELTDEQRQQSFADGMSAVQQAGISDGDLTAARRLIADLEIVSPNTVASLERFGAGNDINLIKMVVREAKRRGYRNGYRLAIR